MSWRGALVLGPESRGLCPPIQGRGARRPAVCGVQLHRCAPSCVCHVRRTQALSTGYGEAYWEPGCLERSPPPGRRHPTNLLVVRSGLTHSLYGPIILIQMSRLGNHVAALKSKRDQFSATRDAPSGAAGREGAVAGESPRDLPAAQDSKKNQKTENADPESTFLEHTTDPWIGFKASSMSPRHGGHPPTLSRSELRRAETAVPPSGTAPYGGRRSRRISPRVVMNKL